MPHLKAVAESRGDGPCFDTVRQQTRLVPGLLIATPQLADPNFQRAVVLMVEHASTGSMGLVLNRTARLTLGEVASGQELELAPGREKDRVHVGGPVEPQRGFVLHDDASQPERHRVGPGLFLSLTLDALGPLLRRPEGQLRFCLGYAGWGPGQLEEEIASGAWLTGDVTAAAAFHGEPDTLWESTLRGMGLEPGWLVPGGGGMAKC